MPRLGHNHAVWLPQLCLTGHPATSIQVPGTTGLQLFNSLIIGIHVPRHPRASSCDIPVSWHPRASELDILVSLFLASPCQPHTSIHVLCMSTDLVHYLVGILVPMDSGLFCLTYSHLLRCSPAHPYLSSTLFNLLLFELHWD